MKISVIATILLLVGCHNHEASPPPAPKPVLVSTVHHAAQSERRFFTATVGARVEGELGFRVGGKVTARLFDVGDAVKEGQVLARLDDADYRLAAGAADDQVAAAAADALTAAADERRFRRLSADETIGMAEYERQKARADAAQARLDQARRQALLAANRKNYTTLLAPYAGVVTSLHIEAGQVVAEGQAVMALARDGARELTVDLPESMVSAARMYEARYQAADGAAIELRLRELAPVAGTQGRTSRARFAAAAASRDSLDKLPLGSTAQVWLQTKAASRESILLPVNALIKANGEAGVWTVADGQNTLRFTPVKVTGAEADSVGVAGLSEGMRVVTAGAQKLSAGMQVKPVERAADGMVAAAAGGGR